MQVLYAFAFRSVKWLPPPNTANTTKSCTKDEKNPNLVPMINIGAVIHEMERHGLVSSPQRQMQRRTAILCQAQYNTKLFVLC